MNLDGRVARTVELVLNLNVPIKHTCCLCPAVGIGSSESSNIESAKPSKMQGDREPRPQGNASSNPHTQPTSTSASQAGKQAAPQACQATCVQIGLISPAAVRPRCLRSCASSRYTPILTFSPASWRPPGHRASTASRGGALRTQPGGSVRGS